MAFSNSKEIQNEMKNNPHFKQDLKELADLLRNDYYQDPQMGISDCIKQFNKSNTQDFLKMANDIKKNGFDESYLDLNLQIDSIKKKEEVNQEPPSPEPEQDAAMSVFYEKEKQRNDALTPKMKDLLGPHVHLYTNSNGEFDMNGFERDARALNGINNPNMNIDEMDYTRGVDNPLAKLGQEGQDIAQAAVKQFNRVDEEMDLLQKHETEYKDEVDYGMPNRSFETSIEEAGFRPQRNAEQDSDVSYDEDQYKLATQGLNAQKNSGMEATPSNQKENRNRNQYKNTG